MREAQDPIGPQSEHLLVIGYFSKSPRLSSFSVNAKEIKVYSRVPSCATWADPSHIVPASVFHTESDFCGDPDRADM